MIYAKHGRTFTVLALTFTLGLLGPTSTVLADNPVLWDDLYVESFGGDASWDSATNIDTGFPFYEGSFAVGIAVQLGGFLWVNVDNPADSGIFPGPLPITFIDDNIEFDDGGVITTLDIVLDVDALGQGHVNISNVSFGTFGGEQITGVKVGAPGVTFATDPGTIELMGTNVPEPTTLALCGLAAIPFLSARRRR